MELLRNLITLTIAVFFLQAHSYKLGLGIDGYKTFLENNKVEFKDSFIKDSTRQVFDSVLIAGNYKYNELNVILTSNYPLNRSLTREGSVGGYKFKTKSKYFINELTVAHNDNLSGSLNLMQGNFNNNLFLRGGIGIIYSKDKLSLSASFYPSFNKAGIDQLLYFKLIYWI